MREYLYIDVVLIRADADVRELYKDLHPEILARLDSEFAKIEADPPPAPVRVSKEMATTKDSIPAEERTETPVEGLALEAGTDKLSGEPLIPLDVESDLLVDAEAVRGTPVNSGPKKRRKIGRARRAHLAETCEVRAREARTS